MLIHTAVSHTVMMMYSTTGMAPWLSVEIPSLLGSIIENVLTPY